MPKKTYSTTDKAQICAQVKALKMQGLTDSEIEDRVGVERRSWKAWTMDFEQTADGVIPATTAPIVLHADETMSQAQLAAYITKIATRGLMMLESEFSPQAPITSAKDFKTNVDALAGLTEVLQTVRPDLPLDETSKDTANTLAKAREKAVAQYKRLRELS